MLSRSSSSSSRNYPAPTPTPTPTQTLNRPSGRDYGAYTPNSNESNYGQLLSGPRFFRTSNPDSVGAMEGQRLFGGRTSSFGSDSFPAPQRSSVQIVILDNEPRREANPLTRQIMPHEVPLRPMDQWHFPLRRTEEQYNRSSSRTDQNKALESLKREIYTPNSKRLTNRVNLYYRDTPVNPEQIHNQEDGKRCAICLEDFERGQEVMVTPCKHMFHEECIVPWVKSNGQCPNCRFVLGPKTSEPRMPFNRSNSSNNAVNVAGPGLSTEEFFAIIMALGDGPQLDY